MKCISQMLCLPSKQLQPFSILGPNSCNVRTYRINQYLTIIPYTLDEIDVSKNCQNPQTLLWCKVLY